MWFDDEITGWYRNNIGKRFIDSTRSPNVSVYEDKAKITALNRTRTLRIYTPPNYKDSEKRYPVLYMLDAQRLFDNASTGTRGEEGIDEVLDEAIAKGSREIMIVAIDASEHRDTELNPYNPRNEKDNEAQKMMDYIVRDLKPMIDAEYRTLSDRNNTGIMGASLGGLFSFYTLMHYPEVFSKAGVLSPSFLHSDKVFDLPTKLRNKEVQIYMNVGGQEFYGMLTVFNLMKQKLEEEGFTDEQLKTKIVKDGGHEPLVWRDGFKEAYSWFFEEPKSGVNLKNK